MRSSICLCLIFSSLLTSCKVGPDFKLPDVMMPKGWKNGKAGDVSDLALPGEWWRLYGSSELNRLVEQALTNNQELRGALARVETARAMIGVQQSEMFPTLGMKSGTTYEYVSRSAFAANLPGGIPLPDTERWRYQNVFEFGWEADLWGRVRRGVEGSRAAQAAAVETVAAHRLSLAAEVARLFFLARSMDRQLGIVNETINWRQEAVKLQESRFKGGLANEMDVSRARTELELARADLAAIQRHDIVAAAVVARDQLQFRAKHP